MYFNTMIDNGLLNCRESVRPPLLNHRPMKRRSSTRRRWAMVLPVRYVRLQQWGLKTSSIIIWVEAIVILLSLQIELGSVVFFYFIPALLLSLAMGTSFAWFFQGTSVLTFSLAFLFLAGNSHRKRFFWITLGCGLLPACNDPTEYFFTLWASVSSVSSCFLCASSCAGDVWACGFHWRE